MKRILAAWSLILALPAFGQGSLTPPGAPGETMKSLDQIEPRTAITQVPVVISNSGSYYFTTNLVCTVPSAQAIRVITNNVSIDLCGFTLEGTPGLPMVGIYQSAELGLRVANGFIRGFEGNAIHAGGSANIFRNLTIASGYYGIGTGFSALVEDCTIHNLFNESGTAIGVYCDMNSVVRNCSISYVHGEVSSAGIYMDAYGVVSKCSVANVSPGVGGISRGIYGSQNLVATECSVSSCDGVGFRVGTGTIRDCIAKNNLIGVSVSDGVQLDGVVASGSVSNGFQVGSNCRLTHCIANGNGYQGMDVTGSRNVISDSTCNGNTSSGIFVWEDENRIENNHLAGNDYGLYLRYWAPDSLAQGNIVMRNTAIRNTSANFEVGVSNWVANIDTTGAFAGANDNYAILP